MSKKNLEIEALRGLAIIFVIISHSANLLYWVPNLGADLQWFGFAHGVDLFFVISGFVITRAFRDQLLQAWDSGTFLTAARSFMLRRFFRIMPAALVWLVLVCACSVWFNTTGIFGALEGNFTDALSVAFNLSNFHFAQCAATVMPPTACGYNGIYWSISLEEQFYIAFPLIALLSGRAILAITVAVVAWLTLQDRTLLLWFTRVDGLMIGACLALASGSSLWSRFEPKFLRIWWARAAVIGVTLALFSLMPTLAARALPHLWTELIVLCCALLVAVAGYDRGFAFAPGPFRAVLTYIGTRSFSLYLAHNVSAWLVREASNHLGLLGDKQVPLHPLLTAAAGLALMFLLAEVSYWLVEVPWRNWGRVISDYEGSTAGRLLRSERKEPVLEAGIQPLPHP